METFSALLAICAGNSPVTVEFPAQRPVTRGFNVFFDMRQNRLVIWEAHYDVTEMIFGWARSELMGEDVTRVTSSVIS